MISDGKAVGFIPDMLDHMQRRRFPFQINALTLPFQKNFFILFRQGNDLNVQPLWTAA